MFTHASKEKNGFRWWCHLKRRGSISTEVCWWSRFCHFGIDVDDEGWHLALALPPLAIWFCFDIGLWTPKCQHVFEGREFFLTDRREFRIAIHDWRLRLTPWGRWGEWRKKDPWWIRGASLDLKDLLLGRTAYECVNIGGPANVLIPMPEGEYLAVFQRQRQTWKRPRGWRIVRESFDINIPRGIPFAGKGENSWDCEDDGLFGMSAEGSMEEAKAEVRRVVLERRSRYGDPSKESIQKALATS